LCCVQDRTATEEVEYKIESCFLEKTQQKEREKEGRVQTGDIAHRVRNCVSLDRIKSGLEEEKRKNPMHHHRGTSSLGHLKSNAPYGAVEVAEKKKLKKDAM